jgi:hypothetical protein
LKWVAGGLAIIALAGCSKPHELMPLRVGNEWRYNASTNLGRFLNTVKVTREVPTQMGMGYELRGWMGDSILVWDGSILKATVLSGTRFNPPIPILDGAQAEATLKWKGRVHSAGTTEDATADLKQTSTEWGSGNKVKATETNLNLVTSARTLTVNTVYVRGKGPVSQSQHVSVGSAQSSFEVSLEYLHGPYKSE